MQICFNLCNHDQLSVLLKLRTEPISLSTVNKPKTVLHYPTHLPMQREISSFYYYISHFLSHELACNSSQYSRHEFTSITHVISKIEMCHCIDPRVTNKHRRKCNSNQHLLFTTC